MGAGGAQSIEDDVEKKTADYGAQGNGMFSYVARLSTDLFGELDGSTLRMKAHETNCIMQVPLPRPESVPLNNKREGRSSAPV